MSKCKKCGYPQYCPCAPCHSVLPEGMKPWIFTQDGWSIQCAGCGRIDSIDNWEQDAVEQGRVK